MVMCQAARSSLRSPELRHAYHAAVTAGRGEDGTGVPDALEVGGPGVPWADEARLHVAPI
jgi:hypothetical protein